MAKNPIYFPEKRIDDAYALYKEILAERQPYLVSHLVVNGKDLIRLGYRPGRDIGDILKQLIEAVIIDPKLNNREFLISEAKEYRRKKK